MGIELLRRSQITPSESHQASQKKAEAPVASFSVPVIEASAPQGATSDVPAPMETGGAGDSQFWAEQTEAEDDFKRCRPAKHPRLQSRRQEDRPTLPFPLQDEEGRCTSTQELYRHAGQQPPARHNVATMGITHLHPVVLPHEARSLGNQVLCMVAEYHLTSNAQGSSSLSPVLLEVVRDLLPPIEDYVGGGAFCGTRDVRVVERAKTLWIATWLHHLDMAVEGDDLIEARREESDMSVQKRIKREIDLRWKDIENLRVAISHHQSNLRWGQPEDIATHDDDSSDHGAGEVAEAEMAIAPETDDTPSVSAMTQSSDPPPAKGQAHVMEVDDEDGNPPPASPTSPADDDLLTGGGAVRVKGDLANLTVSSPKNPDGGGADASI